MSVITLMLIGTCLLMILLILLILLIALTPAKKEPNNNAIKAIKQQVEEEVVSESVPYKLPKDGKKPNKALPSV